MSNPKLGRDVEARLEALEKRALVTRGIQRRKKRLARPKRIMSQEHLDRFEGNRLVRIQLMDKHSINGALYGPGIVQVSRKLASVLLENDQRSIQEEQRFRGGTRAFVVGPAKSTGRQFGSTEVRPDFFEQEVNSRQPALTDPHHGG